MRGILDRRHFIFCGASWLAGTAAARAAWPFGRSPAPKPPKDIRGHIFKGDAPKEPGPWSCEGYRYRKLLGGKVACGVCPHRCLLSPGDRSVCRSKVNIGGTLYSLAYGNPCAVHVDPMEKKPLYHFLPGSPVFSLAVAGCNFRCLNCQNWEISQSRPEDLQFQTLSPEQAVAQAAASRSRSIAYTYSEPITFIEYMTAIAARAKPAGIRNLLISNGYINPDPLKALCRLIDGANINLKAFDDATYRGLNGGRLQPVLDTLTTLHNQGVHLEVTHLVVPGYTDDGDLFRQMCSWILDHLGPDHPFHLLRFFPRYKLDRLAPTPVSTLERFRALAVDAGLRYVYIGNVPGHPANHTHCHHCGKLIIERQGYRLPRYYLTDDRCGFCGGVIPGVWQSSEQ